MIGKNSKSFFFNKFIKSFLTLEVCLHSLCRANAIRSEQQRRERMDRCALMRGCEPLFLTLHVIIYLFDSFLSHSKQYLRKIAKITKFSQKEGEVFSLGLESLTIQRSSFCLKYKCLNHT